MGDTPPSRPYPVPRLRPVDPETAARMGYPVRDADDQEPRHLWPGAVPNARPSTPQPTRDEPAGTTSRSVPSASETAEMAAAAREVKKRADAEDRPASENEVANFQRYCVETVPDLDENILRPTVEWLRMGPLGWRFRAQLGSVNSGATLPPTTKPAKSRGKGGRPPRGEWEGKEQLRDYILANPDATVAETAEQTGWGKTTVKKYRALLK